MSNNAVYDKRQVIGLLIGCAIAIIIFHIGWINHFLSNMANPVFSIGYGVLLGVDIVEAIGAYRYYKDDSKDWKRWAVAIITFILLAWLGFWASGKNDDKMFKNDVEKAKQTSFIQGQKELFHIMTPEEIFIEDIIWLNNTNVRWALDGRSISRS